MSQALNQSETSPLATNPGFSTDIYTINMPRDFVSACNGLDSDAILLLLHFFSTARGIGEKLLSLPKRTLLESFSKWHGGQDHEHEKALRALIDQGFLLAWEDAGFLHLLPGTPAGRFLLQELALEEKKLANGSLSSNPNLKDKRPNIYQLYESHIGMITPMMAEQLKQDEKDFPPEWIEDALREAVHRNVRNWNYVRAILKAWKDRGRDKKYEGHQSDIEAFRKLAREQQERNEP